MRRRHGAAGGRRTGALAAGRSNLARHLLLEPGYHRRAVLEGISRDPLDPVSDLRRRGDPQGLLEGEGEMARGLEAVLRLACQTPHHESIHLGRDLRVGARWLGVALDDLGEQILAALRVEQPTSREYLPQHYRRALDIRASIGAPLELRGRHVGQLALDLTRHGGGEALGGFGNSEVQDASETISSYEDVLR